MTVTYTQARDAAQLDRLRPQVAQFFDRYVDPGPGAGLCRGQTVFFFPGGMGSRLVRASQKYQEGVGVPASASYPAIWPSWDAFFFGGWRKLKMHKDLTGCFRDHSDRPIVADGGLKVFGIDPQKGFVLACELAGINYFVFGWDWRRRLDETRDFFLNTFRPFVQQEAINRGKTDPFLDFSLVGHSLGGMVVNLIARQNPAGLRKAITVSTPAYGYAGQLHRWFEGEPLLTAVEIFLLQMMNLNNLVEAVKQDMLEVIASMPALYPLHFLDFPTYTANQAALGLSAYPSSDLASAAVADAYHPQLNGGLVRYPGNTGFDIGELNYALAQFQTLSSPMSPAVASKFHNIRGITTGGTGANTTGSVRWDWISPNYNASGPSPIKDGPDVAGDDTQPAWTTRLLGANDLPIAHPLIEHACMMNDAIVNAALIAILCPLIPTTFSLKKAQQAAMKPFGKKKASDKEVQLFLRWVAENHDKRAEWPSIETAKARSVLPPHLQERIGDIMRRLYGDLLRGPRAKKPGAKGRSKRRSSKASRKR